VVYALVASIDFVGWALVDSIVLCWLGSSSLHRTLFAGL
jgi:hypothetical protein